METLDVQGTKVLIAPVPQTKWVDCAEAAAGFAAGNEALCPLTLGELVRTRPIDELSCTSNDNSIKSAGKLSYGDFTLELLFDNDDVDGQSVLLNAFNKNKPVMLGLVALTGYIVFTECLVSADAISYPDGSKVGYSITVSPYGGLFRCNAGSVAPVDCALSIGGLTATEYNLGGFLYSSCNIFGV